MRLACVRGRNGSAKKNGSGRAVLFYLMRGFAKKPVTVFSMLVGRVGVARVCSERLFTSALLLLSLAGEAGGRVGALGVGVLAGEAFSAGESLAPLGRSIGGGGV